MKQMDRIGVDIGLAGQAVERASAATDLGARVVRLRLGLGGASEVGPAFIAQVREGVTALAERGLKVLAVIDGDLTVAPDGMGAFADRPPGPLARAWVEEMIANTADLARALGESVTAWEILPLPNAGPTPRISASRWLELVRGIAGAIRAADPGARIVSGALQSDDRDDGLAYLEEALAAAEGFPADGLGLSLGIMASGSPSEAILAAGLRDRVERLAQALAGRPGLPAEGLPIWVTSVGWDAHSVGELGQAGNVWTALNALSAHPRVASVIWCGLTDDNPSAAGMAGGLIQGSDPLGNQRRPAWSAFRDFTTYARQISMPAASGGFSLEPPPAPSPIAADDAPPQDTGSLEIHPQRPQRVEDRGGWTTAGVAGAAALAGLGPVGEGGPREPEAPPMAEAPTEPAPAAAEAVEPDAMARAQDALAAAEGWARPAGPEAPVEPPEAAPALPAAAAEPVAVEPPPAPEEPAEEHRGMDLAGAAAAAVAATAAGLAGLLRNITGGDRPEEPSEAPAAGDEGARPAPAPIPAAAEADDGDPAAPPTDADDTELTFRIPTASDLLQGMGLGGEALSHALEALRQRYGSHQWLPAGQYKVRVPNRLLKAGEAGTVEPAETAEAAAPAEASEVAPPAAPEPSEPSEPSVEAAPLVPDAPGQPEPAVDRARSDLMAAEGSPASEPLRAPTPPAAPPPPPEEPAPADEPTAEVEAPAETAAVGAHDPEVAPKVPEFTPPPAEPLADALPVAQRQGESEVGAPAPAPDLAEPSPEAEPAEAAAPPAETARPVEPGEPAASPPPVPMPAPAPAPPRTMSNQMMISALYRAGGGAWGLFERAGLSLRDLAARRTQAYSGPALAAMSGLSEEERAAVQRELDLLT